VADAIPPWQNLECHAPTRPHPTTPSRRSRVRADRRGDPFLDVIARDTDVAIIRNLSGAGLRIDHPESLVACLERLRDAILADDADAAVAAGLGLPEPVGDAVADAQSAAAEARRA
jgi:hypothetical protein